MSRLAGSDYSSLAGGSPSGASTAGLAVIGLDASGAVTAWGRDAAALLGYERLSAEGRPFSFLFCGGPAIDGEAQRIVRSALAHRHVEEPALLRRSDGAPLWTVLSVTSLADHDDVQQGYIAVIRAIVGAAAPLAPDEALLNERLFVHTLIESMPGILYFYDAAGRFIRWNKNFEQVSGYTADEIAGMHPLDFFRAADQPMLEGRIAEVFETGESSVEADFIAKDGSPTPYFFTGRRVLFEKRLCLVGIGIDISKRRRAERKLAESERNYRELVENANSIILRWNADGRITMLNEFGLRFFGYSADEIMGRQVLGTLVPASETGGRDLSRMIEEICSAPESFEENENENIRRNGERVWVAWTNRVVRNAEGEAVEILSVGADITARKRAEAERDRAVQALRESEERYRSLFNSITDPVLVYDEESLAFLAVNDAALATYGYTRDEFASISLETIQLPVFPQDALGVRRHRRKDGGVIDVEISTHALEFSGRRAVVAVARDVTQRLKSEREAAHTANLLQAVADGTTDAVFVKDRAGVYLLVNKAAAAFIGRPADFIVGKDDAALFGPADAAEIQANDRLVMESNAPQTVEERIQAAMGLRVFLATKVPYRDEKGNVIGVIGVSRDVTELKNLEEQLRQSHKMEAIGRLAGGVAHDFNNLLTVVAGYSDRLLELPSLAAADREAVHAIREAGRRAALLTRQLLGFSRRTVLQPEVLDLNAVVAETSDMLRRLIGEDILFETNLCERLSRVKVDPSHLNQILMNLAVNARDAMPMGGRVTVETRDIDLLDEHAAGSLGCPSGLYVMLGISDTGCGMSKEVQARIFEPFFTTKEVGRGTGLGLSMVYGIVQQSGGAVQVSSEPGRGTVFRIYLPAVDGAVAVSPGEAVAADHGGGETILLVEDEESVRLLASRILSRYGYTVLSAADGLDGLCVMQSHDGPIHLVLSDVIMPNMGGPELVEHVRRLHPTVRVLFSSGYTDDAVFRHGLQTSNVSFIQKPYSPRDLAHKVRHILDEPGRPPAP